MNAYKVFQAVGFTIALILFGLFVFHVGKACIHGNQDACELLGDD